MFACGTQGWSQSTTEIRGRVQDRSGHAVSSAFVIITAQDTSLMRAATTDENGEFSLPSLPVGTYSLQIKADGFADFDAKDIRASIGEVFQLNVKLAPPGPSNSHSVQLGERSLVESSNAQLGVVMTEGEVTQLPLKSRDTFELLQLQPGVQSTIGSNLFFGSDRPGVVSVSGARTRSNNYEVNGGYSADQLINSPSVQPSPDSISEFRVISHDYEAALGRNSGSVLNVVTKSGSSTWHGTAYEFLRNNVLNAKGYFDPEVPDFKQNQFGATLGGSLRRDKTFFFSSYEGRRQRQGISSTPVPVPTSAERQGDFSAGPAFTGTLSDDAVAQALNNRPGCAAAVSGHGGASIAAGTQYAAIFPGNVIPSQCADPTAVDLMQQFVPLPNGSNGTFTASPDAAVRSDQATLRLDDNLTGQQQMSFYYYGTDASDLEPFSYLFGQGANVPGFGTKTRTRYQQFNLSHTWTITAKTINEVRFVYYREGEGSLLSPTRTNSVQNSCVDVPADQCFTDPANPQLGINPGYGAQYEGVPFIALSGGFSYGNNQNGNFSQTGNVYQAKDTYSRILGKHTLKSGADIRNQRLHQFYFYDISGGYQFYGGGSNDVGYSTLVPNYLLGLPDSFSEGSANAVDARTTQLNVFTQDSWKMRPNMTLNYGLRWEFNTPFEDAGERIQAFRPGQATTQYPCVLSPSDPILASTGSNDCSATGPARSVFPLGLVLPGDAEVPSGLTKSYPFSFAPRLGLAWSPNSSTGMLSRITGGPGHSSVRLGWGMFYDSVEEMMFGENLTAQPPFGGSTILSNTFFNTPFLAQDGSVAPNPFHGFLDPTRGSPIDFAEFRPVTLYGNLPTEFRSQYSTHYHLTFQRELSRSTLLQFGYVGSQGHRLTATLDQNYGVAQTCLDLNQIPGMSCGPFGADSAYTIPAGGIPSGVTVHLPYGSVPSVTGPNPNPITLIGLRRYSSPLCEPTTGVGCPPDGVPVFGSIFANLPIANSSYNSLQTLVNRHFSHGLQFLASYTWSKSIDNASSFENSVNPIDPSRSRSLSLFDARHRLVFSNFWQIPGPSRQLWTHHLLEGWALSTIFTLQSGFPIRMTSENDQELMSSFDFESAGEPEQIGPFRRLSPQSSGGYYFDPASFTDAPLGQIGNTPRTICCGPGIANLDLGIHKTFSLNEEEKLEFRAEIFNILNHTQFMNPDGDITDGASFGQVSGARDPRLIQFALRLTF
ncbi:MAG TPA: carboxypeptidase regulatory-like domain-containing protein [Terriglobales bacterium]|nr:carboxypeptidase regulatory-like domain-containing protein [Terriglobales bacterium]